MHFFPGEGGSLGIDEDYDLDKRVLDPSGEAAEGVVPVEGTDDVENPHLSRELKIQATDHALKIMREVFHEMDGYAVFASTATYLHGKKQNIPELQTPPGDFDAIVFDQKTLDTLRERLTNTPGVTFENNGRYVRQGYVGEKTFALKGQLAVSVNAETGQKMIAVPFEIFYATHLVPQQIYQRRQPIGGLQTLSLDALKDQYLKNLEFESRVQGSVDQVANYLANPEVAEAVQKEINQYLQMTEQDQEPEMSGTLSALTERFDLDVQALRRTYEELNMLSQTNLPTIERERLVSQLARHLSGIKTKIPARKRSIEKISRALNDEHQPA